MKKAISILLAILMIFTLISCKSGTGAGSQSPANAPSPTQSSPSPAAASDPGSASQAPEVTEDPSVNADSAGFFTSGVDPHSRKTYKIVYAYTMTMLLTQMMADSMKAFEDKLNFTLTTSTGELDADRYITNIQTLAGNGDVDGFVAEIDPQVSTRINEIYQELGIPYIGLFNSVRDESGSEIVPCVGLDQFAAGATTIQWLYDNYKTYWGDIDTSEIALLDFTFSTLPDLQARSDGAVAKFKELFPNNTMFFTADAAVTNTVDADSSFKEVSAIFAAHPEVKYWWVPCAIETFAQGAARAAESMSIESKVLITDVGSDVLCSEWENNYDGCWVSCLAISNYLYAAPTISGLISMIDGKSTPESLWPHLRAPGDKCTFYMTSSQMVTKDTYKDYFNAIATTLEFPLPYPSN